MPDTPLIHLIASIVGPTVAITIYLLTARKRERARQDKQHRENQVGQARLARSIRALEQKIEILPLHGHTEEDGNLTAEGIWPKNRD